MPVYDLYGKLVGRNDICNLNDIGAKIISGEIKTISLIGDSITDGGAGSNYNGSLNAALSSNTAGYCWANMLKAFLGAKYGTIVNNFGQYGSGISQQVAKFDTTVPADGSVDLVIWLTGTNNRNNTDNWASYKTALKSAIQTILERAKYLIVMDGITAIESNENSHTYSMQDCANVIIQIAHETGCNFLPMYNRFNEYFYVHDVDVSELVVTDSNNKWFDGYGVHPKDAGYEVMLRIILRELGIPVAFYDDLSVSGDYYPFA